MTTTISSHKLSWINIVSPTPDELTGLQDKFDFHDLDMEDCRSRVQRPKIEDYDDYKFLVLQFPVSQSRNNRLSMEDIDIFLGKDFIITIQRRKNDKIEMFFNKIQNDTELTEQFFSNGSDYLLYKIIQELVLAIFPLMNRISYEIDYIDNSFETISPSKLIERLSVLRRNIIFLQTTLKPQRNIFLIFENQIDEPEKQEMDVYWGDIGDYLGKILDMAEDYQELTEGLYSSIDTLLNYRINNIMKTLTIFSVIMLPLTFITSFYGMNIKLPLQNLFPEASIAPAGILGGTMAIITIVMIIIFKIRRF